MKDDLLSKMTSALSEEYDGATAVPEATRARVVRMLAERRPRRRKWAAIGIPAFVIFGGSSAWAAATGNLPKIVERAVAVLVGEVEDVEEVEVAGAPQKGKGNGQKASPPAELPPPPAEETNEPEVEEPEIEEPVVQEIAPVVPPERPSQPAMAPTAPKNSGPAASKKPAPEDHTALLTYQAAHRAHFQKGDCTSAITGYRKYLAEEPGGTFALEAKYNLGVCLVRMGQNTEAKKLLTPFAKGTYGSYRKDSAQKLLEAIGN